MIRLQKTPLPNFSKAKIYKNDDKIIAYLEMLLRNLTNTAMNPPQPLTFELDLENSFNVDQRDLRQLLRNKINEDPEYVIMPDQKKKMNLNQNKDRGS